MILSKVNPVLYPLRYKAWVQYIKLRNHGYYLKYKDPQYKKQKELRKKKKVRQTKYMKIKEKMFQQVLNNHL